MGKVKLLGGSQENLNEVLTEQEDIITQIKAILPFKGAGMSEGQYVWKKSKLEQVTITNPSVVMNSGSGKIKVTTTDDIDLSLVDLSFFDGFVSSEPYKFYTQNGQLYFYSTDYPVTAYNTETHELTCNAGISNATFTYTGTKETPKLVFEDYVVADDEGSYPDGGESDGYWYELAEEGFSLELLGCTKYAVDTFSFTSDTFASNATLHHSLGGIPKFIYISTDYTHSDYLSSDKTYIKEGIFFSKGITNSSSTGNAYGVGYNIGAYGGKQLVSSSGEDITDTTLSNLSIGANWKVATFKAGATYAIISMA